MAVIDAWEYGHQVFACGNGGNAAYVANLVTDLNLHPFVSEDKKHPIQGKRLYAINLCDSVSTITAIMNDIGPEHIFSEQLKYMGKDGDVFIGLSGSGNSGNVIKAAQVALDIGMNVLGITRNGNSEIVKMSHKSIVVPGHSKFPGQTGKNDNNFHFEDCISKISHIITGILKRKVQGVNILKYSLTR